MWATLLALEVDGELVLGVVSAPALGTRWWARRGGGAWRNGELVRVSSVARVEDAQMAYSGVTDFEDDGRGDGFLALARRCWRTRGLGDFWSHVLVADGSVDISVEVGGLQPVGRRAVPADRARRPAAASPTSAAPVRADGGNVLATNGLLHDEALRRSSSRGPPVNSWTGGVAASGEGREHDHLAGEDEVHVAGAHPGAVGVAHRGPVARDLARRRGVARVRPVVAAR